jgi:hypothetical protein
VVSPAYFGSRFVESPAACRTQDHLSAKDRG